MKIGKWLLEPEARSDRKLIGFLASRLEVTTKIIRNWREMAELGAAPPIGRPRYSNALKSKAKRLVEEELRRQRYPGSRPIAAALPELPVRLVQSCVREEKRSKRQRSASIRAQHRVSTKVLAREAVWTMDGTQIGRDMNRKPIEVQVIKDRGSLAYRATRTGQPASSEDVVRLLDQIKSGGSLPLVCATDNGSIYCSEQTQKYFEHEKIIHLRSLPRTPEHNGAVEVSIRSLKEGNAAAGESIEKTAEQINKNRLFSSKGFKSPTELDENMIVAYNKVNRAEFYERCRMRLNKVLSSTLSKSQKRCAEREVIFRTLEEYGLIERTRGNRPFRGENVEVFL